MYFTFLFFALIFFKGKTLGQERMKNAYLKGQSEKGRSGYTCSATMRRGHCSRRKLTTRVPRRVRNVAREVKSEQKKKKKKKKGGRGAEVKEMGEG